MWTIIHDMPKNNVIVYNFLRARYGEAQNNGTYYEKFYL